MEPNQFSYHQGLHRYALVTACCTFFLVLAGAMVTSTGSSLSVPDWPLSFGKFFPPMTGGVFYEHGHRMVAGTVALMMTGLAFAVQRIEKRKGVKALAWGAVGAVVLQAVLGGVTVLMHLPTAVSVFHAGLAQIFLCLTVSLALVTSKGWMEEKQGRLAGRDPVVPRWTLIAVLAIYTQVIIGAVMRHSGGGLAIPDFPLSFGHLYPPEWTFLILVNFTHRVGALIVLLLVNFISYRVCVHFTEEPGLFLPAVAGVFLVWLQCVLGMLVVVTGKDAFPTSAHVLIGAGVLASMLVLALSSRRVFIKG